MVGDPATHCPICKGKIIGSELPWYPKAGVLTGHGYALALSSRRAAIFDALWKQRNTGRTITKDQILRIAYADDPDGGPLSDTLPSHLKVIRPRIAPFGLTIDCGGQGRKSGYRLVAR